MRKCGSSIGVRKAGSGCRLRWVLLGVFAFTQAGLSGCASYTASRKKADSVATHKVCSVYPVLYRNWRLAVESPLIKSSSVPGQYIGCVEARVIVLEGVEIVPYLLRKMEIDEARRRYVALMVREIMRYDLSGSSSPGEPTLSELVRKRCSEDGLVPLDQSP